MTKKFTEEQYQKIIEIQADRFPKTIISEGMHMNDGGFWKVVSEKMPLLSEYVFNNDLHFELAAIANPLTREWAHDEFVEKEKKYVWKSKEIDNCGYCISPYKDADGLIRARAEVKKDQIYATESNSLTESEIKAWGYNPEMFDKEEV